MGRGICAPPARTRLDRGSHRRDRVPLGEGRAERYAEFATEFVRLIDVILAGGTEAAVAAKQATSVIPIVFAGDPVGTGPGRIARPTGR
jgi:hypothetical protein